MSISLRLLTFLIFELNATIDRGEGDDIPITDVEAHIDAGDLFPWLQARLAGELRGLDLGLLTPEVAAELNAGLQEILRGYKGQERRQWGVERSGLCLLVAWTAELIQRRQWHD